MSHCREIEDTGRVTVVKSMTPATTALDPAARRQCHYSSGTLAVVCAALHLGPQTRMKAAPDSFQRAWRCALNYSCTWTRGHISWRWWRESRTGCACRAAQPARRAGRDPDTRYPRLITTICSHAHSPAAAAAAAVQGADDSPCDHAQHPPLRRTAEQGCQPQPGRRIPDHHLVAATHKAFRAAGWRWTGQPGSVELLTPLHRSAPARHLLAGSHGNRPRRPAPASARRLSWQPSRHLLANSHGNQEFLVVIS